MSIYKSMIIKIIEKQEEIAGPLALEQAQKVKGLNLVWEKREVIIEGDEKEVINNLIKQYELLLGRASVEACKEAVKGIIDDLPHDKLPDLLC